MKALYFAISLLLVASAFEIPPAIAASCGPSGGECAKLCTNTLSGSCSAGYVCCNTCADAGGYCATSSCGSGETLDSSKGGCGSGVSAGVCCIPKTTTAPTTAPVVVPPGLRDSYVACYDAKTGAPVASPECDATRSDFFTYCAGNPDPACTLPSDFVTKIEATASAELSAAASKPAATPKAATAPAGFLSLKLPPCVSTGDCSLDDIVSTGAAFANLITALSAALFFGTFVYGGARYLLSFGQESSVKAGKDAMIGAAKGMLIVLFAWTIVNYIANAIRGIK